MNLPNAFAGVMLVLVILAGRMSDTKRNRAEREAKALIRRIADAEHLR